MIGTVLLLVDPLYNNYAIIIITFLCYAILVSWLLKNVNRKDYESVIELILCNDFYTMIFIREFLQ